MVSGFCTELYRWNHISRISWSRSFTGIYLCNIFSVMNFRSRNVFLKFDGNKILLKSCNLPENSWVEYYLHKE